MSTAASVAAQRNPFPGLRPFRENEEHVFFGRENRVDAMVNKLAATHFLAVIGTSGSGKSSLVNCGLRPALHQGLMAPAGTRWRIAQFRPGSHPIAAMARALALDGVLFRDYDERGLSLRDIIETTLRMSKLGLIDIYKQAQLPSDVNLLVVVDQFEELIRYRQLGVVGCADPDRSSEDGAAFVNLLLEIKEWARLPIFIVLTMRSDFLGDCTQFPGLAEVINVGQYLVPRMTRDELRATIVGPVGVGGAQIAPVLVTRLVNDVGDNADQLSILQHALNRTWARWESQSDGQGPLDLTHYEAIGTMAHALDEHAESAYAELATPRQRQVCEKLFRALTDKAMDPRGTRRPTTLGTLCALADATQAEVTAVIDVFRKPSHSFLMPPAGEALDESAVIDISHESLMRVWQRLNAWGDEEAQSARTYRRLAETAALHAAGKASLWRNPDLQIALDWAEKEGPTAPWARLYHDGFQAAMGFLEESRRAFEAEETARAKQRRRQLRHTRIFSAVLGVAFLLALGLGILANRQGNEAKRQTRVALETLRVALAWEYIGEHPNVSVAFLREVNDPENIRGWRVATGKVLQMNLGGAPSWIRLQGRPQRIVSAKFSEDGKKLVTASLDHTARVWDADTGKPLGGPMTHSSRVSSAAFSPDGTRVVTASQDKTARVWDATAGKPLGAPMTHKGEVYSASFSPDGTRVVTASQDKTARVWDATSGKPLGEPMTQEGEVYSASFSPDGTRVVTASQDKTARVWDATSGKPLGEPMTQEGEVYSARFSPDGTRVVTASQDKTARVWDAASGKPLGLPMVHSGTVNSTSFSSDGTRIITGSNDGTARIWDWATGRQITGLVHNGTVWAASFSPDGRYVATVSDDGARLWTPSGLLDSVSYVSEVGLVSADYSPGGGKLVAVGWDGEPQILDLLPTIESLQAQLWNLKVDCPDTRSRSALLGQSEVEAERDYQACQERAAKLGKR